MKSIVHIETDQMAQSAQTANGKFGKSKSTRIGSQSESSIESDDGWHGEDSWGFEHMQKTIRGGICARLVGD